MIKQKVQRVAFATALSCLLLVSHAPAALAATATKTPAKPNVPATVNNPSTLQVSPVRTELSIEAGKSGTVRTEITNLTNSPIAVKPIENDFVAGDEKGTPSIILDENSYAPTHSLKKFMVPLGIVTVPAKSTKEVVVTITVPKSAQAGGYYGAVRFAPAAPDGNQQVNLSASVASLILMTVPGPVTEDLRLSNFDIQQNGGIASNFQTPENLEVLLRFENKGNIQQAPFGQIYVKKGNKALYTNNFNQNTPKDNILPDSARRWTIPLQGFGKFGKYTVGATFTYGSKNETIEIEKTIWIIPKTYMIAAAAALGVLILLIIVIVVSLRAYKRKILRGGGGRRYRR